MAPPLANALSGYQQSFVTDFSGSSLPSGWSTFSGTPGGDPGTRWQSSHVEVGNGILQLNATYDANLNEWVTGGTCDCALSQTYGAYFVRSRITGPGPTVVELLWPAGNHSWPPEIDFDETYGLTGTSMATVHYGAGDSTDHRSINIDMTQWHTWGVIWSPSAITYIVDGRVWGIVTASNEIPTIPMTLDIQQQTWCSSGFACPTAPQSTQVDWAAIYSSKDGTQSPVAASSPLVTHMSIDTGLSMSQLSAAVLNAALAIYRQHVRTVLVKAAIAPHHVIEKSMAIRVSMIESMLKHDVQNLGVTLPKIRVHWTQSTSSSKALLNILLTLSS
jgi:hypothetical protein